MVLVFSFILNFNLAFLRNRTVSEKVAVDRSSELLSASGSRIEAAGGRGPVGSSALAVASGQGWLQRRSPRDGFAGGAVVLDVRASRASQ